MVSNRRRVISLVKRMVLKTSSPKRKAPVISKNIDILSYVSNHNFGPSKRSLLTRILGQCIPTIHGVSSNHVEEFIHFRTRWWIGVFNTVDLTCYRISPLFFHSPYEILPYKFLHLRDRIAKAGLTSVQVFWLRL